MAAPYKKLNIKQLPRVGDKITRDTVYWKNYEFPVTRKEFGPINHVEFSPVAPHHFTVTAAAKVDILSQETNEPVKTFTRFKNAARCASFRRDGKLMVVGSECGQVRLFDTQDKSQLRIFKGHQRPTNVTHFLCDNVRVMSGSDDRSLRLWDIASEKELIKYNEHEDYIRCGAASQSSPDIVVTGSYDHTVKMYDSRNGSSVLTVQHGHPVESVLLYPTSGILLSAGGTVVKVWDVLAGGRLVTAFSDHHKTITSLCFASQHKRLLSAGLDRHVKVYDTSTYQVVHTLDYPSAILTVACAPNDDATLVVGMADGLVSIQHRKPEVKTPASQVKRQQKKASYKYALKHYAPVKGDYVVEHHRREYLSQYDKYFKQFEHSKALDAALRHTKKSKKPEVTVSVIQELIRRSAIRPALAGRNEDSLSKLLQFIQRNISNTKFTSIMIDISNMILELYSDEIGQSVQLRDMLNRLKSTVTEEVLYMRSLMGLLGTMETLFSVAEAASVGGAGLTSTGNTDSISITNNNSEQSSVAASATMDTS